EATLLGGERAHQRLDRGPTDAELAAQLDRLGVEVLLDDRKASPGVKFKDAELLGVPWIVVAGRGWADGVVELRDRLTGEKREVPIEDAAGAISTAIG
ncbi:MAG: His/Gly/Thr/Pro-type tRNA ligase C-terminal domain-containing protein, partial [Mycobacterium sp.]